MESTDDLKMPVEMLGRVLHFLAMDGAAIAWQHLAYLTHNNKALRNIAKKMQRPLVLRVGSDKQSEDSNFKFILPFQKATVAEIEIDWGDGSPTQIIMEVGKGCVEHNYRPQEGEYTVRVFPHGPGGADGVWLNHVGWDAAANSLYDDDLELDCWYLPLKSLDTLGSLGVSSLEALFYGADDFNRPLSHLDVSRIENMSFMFYYADAFNQDISRWNVSKVTNMSSMFHQAVSFNQPIGSWNVSNVESMRQMFFVAQSFNQPLGEWDVSSVTDMVTMFCFAKQFNQDIGDWSVSNAAIVTSMFRGASAFDPSCRDRWRLSPDRKAEVF